MKVLIIEDEPATAKRLENLLKELVPGLVLDETIDTVEDSVSFFKKGILPDLVFMDIHLADGNSFEIFEQVDIKCPVIFTTAFDQYAIKAFKVNSIDYLLKPIKKDELTTSLKKYNEIVSSATENVVDITQLMELFGGKSKPELKRLVVRIGAKIIALNISEIAYFQVDNKSVIAVLHKGNRYPVDFTIGQLEEDLKKEDFFRINRRFIISFKAIKSMISYSKSRIKIMLEPGSEEDVISSTDRSGDFKNWLKGK